jgi:hypothetical protein
VGPFHDYRVVLDGYRVPYLDANLIAGTEDLWRLGVDNRFSHNFPDAEFQKIVPLFANAMAVAGGYTRFGKESQARNPWNTDKMEISHLEIVESFESHYLVLRNTRIPYITVRPLSDKEDIWDVIVDHRLHFEVQGKTLREGAWLLANAMAVAAGYSHFGDGSWVPNPFKIGMHGIGTVISEIEHKEN